LADRRGVNPTVRRRRLGAELRRYREAAGLTIDQVAERLECSASKISRLETGQTGSSPRYVRDILSIYGVGEVELESLLEVARETRQRGWWQPYGSVLTSAFIGFEAASKQIRSYEAQCVPGLLQTEEYARALISAAGDDTPEQIDNRVQLRIVRRELLIHDDPVDFWCVLDEAALLRLVGGWAVMQRQLEHLATMAQLSNVKLQVLPLDTGAHAGMDGSFVLLSFPHESDPDTVYVTMATGGVFQEKADELSRYATIFDRLTNAALSAEDSVALVDKMAREPL
jgi:transcriptional regulator with XRE-family HTH domain